MSDFFFARSQMAMSLTFHILFAALSIGMPLMMTVAEGMYLRTRQPVYLDLSKRWSRGMAILFAWARCPAPCCRSNSVCYGRGSWQRPEETPRPDSETPTTSTHA